MPFGRRLAPRISVDVDVHLVSNLNRIGCPSSVENISIVTNYVLIIFKMCQSLVFLKPYFAAALLHDLERVP
jgi:hypothetical protein